MIEWSWACLWRVVGVRSVFGLVVVLGLVPAGSAAPLFGRPASYEVDGSPIGVGPLEFDGERGQDIVTANSTGAEGPSFSFLANRGAGSFLPETRMVVNGYTLQNLITGDFNEDGRGDIAVAADDITLPVRGVVLVYLSTGAGTFAPPLEYRLPGLFPKCLESGNVNGDAALDLAVCHSTNVGGLSEGRVTILLGDVSQGTPSGMFRVGPSELVGGDPSSVAIGFVDGDGDSDLVVGDPVDDAVFVLFGDGVGFGAPVTVGTVDGVSSVAVGPDAPGGAGVAATSRSRNRLMIFEQSAPRTFELLEEHQVFLPSGMRAFDFDQDGDRDLAIASSLGGELWLGLDDGKFERGELIYTASIGPLSTIAIATGDFNDDGRIDVVASSSEDDEVTVVLNGVDAVFTPTSTPTITDTPTITNTPTVTDTPTRTLTPTRTATLTPTNPDPTPTPTPIVTTTPAGPGDANCDGRIDAADLAGVARRIFAPGCPAADVNGDGAVSAADTIALIQLLQAR